MTLALALGALMLFYVIFLGASRPTNPAGTTSRPSSPERRENGYLAASEWLIRSGVRVVSLREPFSVLGESRPGLSPRGNLLIVTLPGVQGFGAEELQPLDRWLRAGNTLLVLAALDDEPDWAQASGAISTDDLTTLTGLSLQPAHAGDGRLRGVPEHRATATRHTLVANRPHAYFEGVHTAVALSDYPAASWVARVSYGTFFLALAHRGDSGADALWTRRVGAGRIIVSGFASLFTNRALGLEGNAPLLANIVSTNVAADGAVIFDDLRQGLAAGYDPQHFFADARLYWTLSILCALWLVWALGGTRLCAPRPPPRTPRETDLVRAAGGYLARVLPARAAARVLYEGFFDGVRARTGLARNGEPTWDWLERHPRIAPQELVQLKAGYAAAHGRGRVRLVALHNLLLHIDRRIS